MKRKMKKLKHKVKAARKKEPISAARDYGIDIDMLRDNLKRSVAERIRRHQIALNTLRKLRKAKRIKSKIYFVEDVLVSISHSHKSGNPEVKL